MYLKAFSPNVLIHGIMGTSVGYHAGRDAVFQTAQNTQHNDDTGAKI